MLTRRRLSIDVTQRGGRATALEPQIADEKTHDLIDKVDFARRPHTVPFRSVLFT